MTPLISDLALILIVAGMVTLLFKRLRQPLVLGYIVAGFMAGPHMPYMPTVHETESIEVWSQIGVIFLMFTLGLEFSFKKIVKMGMKPIVAAVLVMAFMIGMGSAVGHAFRWSDSDCLFLGGMLAMSSTTIIYKAFDDLGLRSKRFAAEVLSVLILEDMLGILLMVILSASAASARFEGTALVRSLLSLGFFLVLWFVVGVYLIPLFLSKAKRWMSGETLLIVAIGLCFLMVVLADKAGYSSAFGAFMMGSILAETVEAEQIEHVVSPVKDLFGAIFFVSVGMLVDPQVLIDYWAPILAITAAIIVGQAVGGTGAFMLAGHRLKVAMRCGFSLAQIGEFAFILASLGLSLGVTSHFLYPVVVAVSIVTTFLTPYMIKAAPPAYALLEPRLPALITRKNNEGAKGAQGEGHGGASATSRGPADSPWRSYLKAILVQTVAYVVLSVAAAPLCHGLILSLCQGVAAMLGAAPMSIGYWVAQGVGGIVTLAILGLFLRPIVMRKNHSVEAMAIKRAGRVQRLLFQTTVGLRFAIGTAGTYYVVNRLSPLAIYWNALIAVAAMVLIIQSRAIKYYSIRMHRSFVHNLQRRDHQARYDARRGPAYARRLLAHDVHMERVVVPARSLWAGRTLQQLDFTNSEGVMVAAILRQEGDGALGRWRINTPSARTPVYPGDILEVIGDDAAIEAFAHRSQREVAPAPEGQSGDHTLHLKRFVIAVDSAAGSAPSVATQSGAASSIAAQPVTAQPDTAHSSTAELTDKGEKPLTAPHPFVGKTLAASGLMRDYRCMAVGFEDEDGHIETATARQVITNHSILWLVGEKQDLERVQAALRQTS